MTPVTLDLASRNSSVYTCPRDLHKGIESTAHGTARFWRSHSEGSGRYRTCESDRGRTGAWERSVPWSDLDITSRLNFSFWGKTTLLREFLEKKYIERETNATHNVTRPPLPILGNNNVLDRYVISKLKRPCQLTKRRQEPINFHSSS